jgi:hypothetical protein
MVPFFLGREVQTQFFDSFYQFHKLGCKTGRSVGAIFRMPLSRPIPIQLVVCRPAHLVCDDRFSPAIVGGTGRPLFLLSGNELLLKDRQGCETKITDRERNDRFRVSARSKQMFAVAALVDCSRIRNGPNVWRGRQD